MIGRTLSHYEIVAKLGEGGMGEVWEARDLRLGRTVAIKLIPRRLADLPEARRRFIQEARTASSIEHPNICTIHEIDETPEGDTFLVMPRYQGEALSDRIARERLPLVEALRIVEDLADALAEAHDHGIVHRDVKPQNVMVDPHGRPILLDFGLAKLMEQTRVTRPGTTLGTLAYMAPEQVRGEDVDARADQFSLGVVLYEVLTGTRPFPGDHDAAVLYAIVNEAAAPLASHDPSLPAALQSIVDRCLAKDPDQRYPDLHELRSELAVVRHGLGSTETADRLPGPRPRASGRAIVAIAALLLLAGLAGWWFVPRGREAEAADPAVAVVEFHDLSGTDDPNLAVGMAGLLHVGMVQNAPCRVVSPSYLQDIRRRLFGVERGPIESSEALEIARRAGADLLLAGQLGETDGQRYVLWQLVDTRSGQSVAARRIQGGELTALADEVIAGVLGPLAEHCGVSQPTQAHPVEAMTTASPEAYRFYVAGCLAAEEQRWGEATDRLQQAVALDSTFALASFELAKIHRLRTVYGPARERTEQAWRWRDRLSIQDRLRLEAWRAQISYHVADAIDTYRELHARWPDDKPILSELLYQLFFWIYLPDALDVARTATKLYPDDADLAIWEEAILSSMGRPLEALDSARRLVAKFPDTPNHWDELAWRYVGCGMADSARVAFRSALEEDPTFFSSRVGLETLPYYQGDLRAGIRALERLLESPEVSEHMRYQTSMGMHLPLGLAWFYREAGRYGRMLELVEEVASLRPDPVDRFYHERYRNHLLLQIHRPHPVLQWADSIAVPLAAGRGEAQDNPQLMGIARWAVSESRTFAWIELDSLDAARRGAAELKALAREFGNNSRLLGLQAEAMIALREADDAAALAALDELQADACYLGRRDIWLRELRAEAYRLAGRPADAVAVHEELLKFYGGHALSHYRLGILHEEMGEADEAAREYRRFLEMWQDADEGLPELVDARRRLRNMETD